jgi:hypothetical protein
VSKRILDGLGHGLGHVGAGVEEELHQGQALDVLRFHVVDAVDVQEVVLVVVGEQPLHLGRVHAAVGLADVNHRQVQTGEDVHLHAADGQDAAHYQADHRHHDGDGMPQREDNGVHR